MANVLVLLDGINYTLRADYVESVGRTQIHGWAGDILVSGYSVEEVCACYVDCIRQRVNSIVCTGNPKDYAYTLSACLAADKGIPSNVVPNAFNGYDVVTDEGKVFQIRRKCGR